MGQAAWDVTPCTRGPERAEPEAVLPAPMPEQTTKTPLRAQSATSLTWSAARSWSAVFSSGVAIARSRILKPPPSQEIALVIA